MRWLLLFMCSVSLIAHPFSEVVPSSPEEIASVHTGLYLDGVVSIASGQCSLTETDLVVRGAQDVLLQRTYIAPSILGCYDEKKERDTLALGKALFQLHAKGWVLFPHLWAGYNQNSPYFQVRDPQGTVLEFDIQGSRGILKTSLYGCSNLMGENPSAEADLRNIEFIIEQAKVRIVWPNGIERVYQSQGRGLYRLDYELLPNGKALRYTYQQQELIRVSSTDPTGRYVYAVLEKEGDRYRSRDGREVHYLSEFREIHGAFKKKKYKETASFQFPVLRQAIHPDYVNTIDYNERTLLTFYDGKNYPISCTYRQELNVLCRVKSFSTPSGSTSFDYDPPVGGVKGGATTVTHPNGSQTIYRFNSLLLVSGIEQWYEGKLYHQKLFSYDEKQHITKIESKDGIGTLLFAKEYECDLAGNPLIERWRGDCEAFWIERAFSKNCLIREKRSDGLESVYTYLGDTRLVTSKTVLVDGTPLRRTEYEYDEANNLIEEREVGKIVTAYTLHQEGPHLHRPEWKIVKDWEGTLIEKTQFVYDSFGNIAKENHFGSDNQCAYQISRVYDDKGNLLSETNRLGQTASYFYDSRGRKIQEVPFSQNIQIQRQFDQKGRITTLREGDHTTLFVYDEMDHLIEKTDYLGLITKMTYDPVHGKPTRIEAFPTETHITLDSWGREIERRDAQGSKTLKKYNGHGDLIEVIHPDGGTEHFFYQSNRNLSLYRDADGLETAYEYDGLGRVCSKKVGDQLTTYRYDAYHLLEEKDSLGVSTFWHYDLAGRKIEERREGRITYFGYDPLGFLAWERWGDHSITYTRDRAGRILKKSIDEVLETVWTYDEMGNVSTIAQGEELYSFVYDPYGRMITKIDPEHNRTLIHYLEEKESLTQRTEDPRGVVTLEQRNGHGMLRKRQIGDQAVEEFDYDSALRMISQDHLSFSYTPGGKRSACSEAGARATFWSYSPGGKIQKKQKPDGSILDYHYDRQGRLEKMGEREFRYDALDRLIGGSGFSRTLDAFGNVLREEWSTGLWIESSYDDSNRPVERRLSDHSRIVYEYEGPFLKQILRFNSNGELLYNHIYHQRDQAGRVVAESGVFPTITSYNRCGAKTAKITPYFQETVSYDEVGNVLRKGDVEFRYDAASQMLAEEGRFTARYDGHRNRIEKNGLEIRYDRLNQREDLAYDANGNVLRKGFVYDSFDQLIEAQGERSVFDALGRRIAKGTTFYLYVDDEEIAAFEGRVCKELKVVGDRGIVAIEIEGVPYAPIQDVQDTIRLLVDWKTGLIVHQNDCDVFGEGLTKEIPYAYAGKRFDEKTGLVYFGQRFYDPSLARWLSRDPLWEIDHSNLYQYLLNNPFSYRDPRGESLIGALCGIGQIALGAALIATGVTIEFATCGAYTIGFGIQAEAGLGLILSGAATLSYEAKEVRFNKTISLPTTTKYVPGGACGDACEFTYMAKETTKPQVYAPDRPLPTDSHGIPKPETDVPHTQLGTKSSKRRPGEKYPQAREFGTHGKPMKTIDFTDHGEPLIHPNPHEHPCNPNPSGGTPQRGSPKPLENWRY